MLDSFAINEVAGAVANRILIVEDDPVQAAALRDLLRERGYQTMTAKDGGQAFSSFQMFKPDFVLLDLILPGQSGFEICERLKQTDKNIPVLVLSEVVLDDARKLAERVGADGYLTKPYSKSALLEQIQDVAQTVWERTHLGRGSDDDQRVRFNCRCGKRFKVGVKHRGRTMTCPDCGEPLVVPRHD